jgi:hypothetical protein
MSVKYLQRLDLEATFKALGLVETHLYNSLVKYNKRNSVIAVYGKLKI